MQDKDGDMAVSKTVAAAHRQATGIRESGFTLIELIMVIIIIGTLAAIAVPRFFDLSGEAESAALEGIAASMSSASAMNYAVRISSNRVKGFSVSNCTDVANLLEGGIPAGYTVTSLSVSDGTTATCTVTQDSTGIAEYFTVHGTI